MDLFLKISVLHANFCWLGDVEEIIVLGRKVLLGKKIIQGVRGDLKSRIDFLLPPLSAPGSPRMAIKILILCSYKLRISIQRYIRILDLLGRYGKKAKTRPLLKSNIDNIDEGESPFICFTLKLQTPNQTCGN